MYYADKIEILKDIFGSIDLSLDNERLILNGHTYPIIDDVIILLHPNQYPSSLKKQLETFQGKINSMPNNFAEDIQFTFSEEWQRFPKILPEHKQEFLQYFDKVNLSDLMNLRICDLGCGIGRWSYFLKDKCRELILIDFSEAIFVARQNLKDASNAIFFMCDLKQLPFRDTFADFMFCLGVLHHLPTNALDEVRVLRKYAPSLLVYLYYALDNRPIYFRILLLLTTLLRKVFSKIRNPLFRSLITWVATAIFYLPFVFLGTLLKPAGLSKYIPLYEGYKGKSLERIRQDVYDRFFTRIEQRFSKKQIMELKNTFSEVIVSDKLPYWHFICYR
jgi:ubiquinone/menaquinone biosynthesis C-methylase UbiE